jgi:hypothetical protein
MSCNPYKATDSSLALYRFGLFQFRSSLLSESRLISFPCLLRYFNSAGVHPYRILYLGREGSPIRKSWAVMLRDSLPKLIAVLRVLHRIYESRHPLCAVYVFIHKFKNLRFRVYLLFVFTCIYWVVGMNKILSFLVETEFLVDFDKSTKKNCIVSFLKNLEILCLKYNISFR